MGLRLGLRSELPEGSRGLVDYGPHWDFVLRGQDPQKLQVSPCGPRDPDLLMVLVKDKVCEGPGFEPHPRGFPSY